jgi:hypothetical protein
VNLVIAKDASRNYAEAVVMDRDDENRIVYRSGLGFNKRGKSACQDWIREFSPNQKGKT